MITENYGSACYHLVMGEYKEARKLADKFESIYHIKDDVDPTQIYMLGVEYGDINLVKIGKKYDKVDLTLHYGKEFLKHDEKIMDFIQNRDKGIVIIHGGVGTGKSSYLKHISNFIPPKKKLIYINSGLLKSFASPQFTNFVLENKDSIFLIEDAEDLVITREDNPQASGYISTLLNIGDGILGDAVRAQLILTFNVDQGNIDKALLRKGRLFYKHQFDNLNVEDANILLKHLKKEHVATESMSLADIYNLDDQDNKTVKPAEKVMGFGAVR